MTKLIAIANSPIVKAVACEIVKAGGAYFITRFLVKNGFTKIKVPNYYDASI